MRKLRDSALAADLTQDTFLRLAEHGRLDNVANPRSYLYRTAHNLAVDHVRKPEKRFIAQVEDSVLEAVPENAPSIDNAVAARQTLDRLHEIVGELPDRTRYVFALIKIDGLSYPEAARHLGISESSVQKHLRIALAHVVQRMKLQ